MELLDNPTTLERMLLDRAKCARTPANGSIELLPLCNMNCDMCYVRLSRREMESAGAAARPGGVAGGRPPDEGGRRIVSSAHRRGAVSVSGV